MPRPSWQTALKNGIAISSILLGGTTNWQVAQSQPIADDTLGNERSIVIPLDASTLGDRIDGGAQRGDNLFHSFQQFNVNTGRSVYFNDPGVNNIITRVTGGTTTQIDGVLGVLGNANLFLINPSGIIFGANASLDVGGSFTATTADAIKFNNQGNFSATNPTTVPLLTVQPSAFVFNQLNPAPIANNSIAAPQLNLSGSFGFGLRVPEGEELTLLGGNISMNGGGVNALGGRVEIGGLGAPGTISRNADGSLSFPDGVARADVLLTNQSFIDVAADSGGSITVNADELEISGSILFAGIGLNSGFVGAQAGDITLNANTIRGGESAGIGNIVSIGGIGDAGDIRITTGSLSLSDDGTRLVVSTFGEGNAGDVIINATQSVSLDYSFIGSSVGAVNLDTFAVGNGGDIRITTSSLTLNNGSELDASTFEQGNAGDVIINARDLVSLDGASVIYSDVGGVDTNTVAVGDGGDISITTGSLSITTNSGLQASTFGQGNAGNIIINARESVSLNGASAIFSTVDNINANSLAVGDGGDIRITAGSLSLMNGSQLLANTLGEGNAGNVIINARDLVSLDGSSIFSSVGDGNANTLAVGDGGDISITTESLSLMNGSQLLASTLGQGNAGDVIINARDLVSLDGFSAIFSSLGAANANTLAVGDSGDISITTDSLSLTNGSQLIASTLGQGNAGNVIINARDLVSLDGDSYIFSSVGGAANAKTIAVGDGGDISITTDSLSLTNGSQLIAFTLGQGNAGNVIINARDLVSLDGSAIFSSVGGTANANTIAVGDGGDISITTDSLSLTNGAELLAFTLGQGNAGNVIINASENVSLNEFTQILTATLTGAQGQGGDVSITADSIRLINSSFVSADTENSFSGGTITLNANSFEATGGAQVLTTTSGGGEAGNITLNIADRITLSGSADPSNIPFTGQAASGLYANTFPNSPGIGGIVQITTNNLEVFDGATIAVSSQGEGKAGDIEITATRVQLEDSRLSAETATVDGGNITLNNVELLQLRNGSSISTTAGTDRAGGNGGNINIDSDLIVAFPNENSDIRANAFTGSGGNVRIDTQGLFGIAFQVQDNPLTNDITASSERGLQGNVNIILPDANPQSGLIQLPEEVVDVSSRIAQSCRGSNGARQSRGEFIVKGRGGLPPSPTDSLVGDESLATWVTLETTTEAETSTVSAPQTVTTAAPIVEAQGWIVDEKGKVTLVATASTSAASLPVICQRQENK